MLIFELINFKLPWLDTDDEGPRNSGLLNAPKATSFEEASAKRAEKIARHQQMRQLEDALNKLRNEERRNDDEAAQVRGWDHGHGKGGAYWLNPPSRQNFFS